MKILIPGRVSINLGDNNETFEARFKKVGTLTDGRKVGNFIMENLQYPGREYAWIKRLGALSASKTNQRDVVFCLTEDVFPAFGLGEYQLSPTQTAEAPGG